MDLTTSCSASTCPAAQPLPNPALPSGRSPPPPKAVFGLSALLQCQFAHNNICVGFAFDQQKNTTFSLSPRPELTLPQERQKVKFVDKVRKARCLPLRITAAKSAGTLQIPCDSSNPTCY